MDTPPSGSSNYSKLSINEIVGDYEKMIVEFQDGTTQELSMATLVGVTEFNPVCWSRRSTFKGVSCIDRTEY
jgi:hypothetical protein